MTLGQGLGEKGTHLPMQSLTVTPPPPLRVPRFVRDWYERRVDRRDYLGQVLRKARRFYLGTFYPEYVKQSVAAKREGDCHRCGLCCQLVYKCPFLGRDGQNLPYCRIYGDLRPANCSAYPFDGRDSEIDTCGYTFTK